MTKPLSAPSAAPAGEPRNVDLQGNCRKCGGIHYGTGATCVFSPEYKAPPPWPKSDSLAGDAVPRTPEPPTNYVHNSGRIASVSDRVYLGHCPKCGEQLGFGHIPEECPVSCEPIETVAEHNLAIEVATRHFWQGKAKELAQKLTELASVTAHKEAEIAHLREHNEKLARTLELLTISTAEREAEVERLRKELAEKGGAH